MPPRPATPRISCSANVSPTVSSAIAGCLYQPGGPRSRLVLMSEARVVGPGQGEVIGDSPERRVEILCDHDAVHATVSRYGPGRAGADLHIHRRHHDLFYVLEGELTLRLADTEDVRASAGTLVWVPPLVVDGFKNAS